MGKLIVIEGLDGSGKSTQIEKLKEYLAGEQRAYRQVKFPKYDDESSALVRMYLKGELGGLDDVNTYGASIFYTVDRYASYLKDWGKDYNSDKIVVSDRYVTSNIPHQMSKLPVQEWDEYLHWCNDLEYTKIGLPKPDLVIYLDMEPEVSRRLIDQRNQGDQSKRDIHEADLNYLLKCRTAALYGAKKEGWTIISCCDGDRVYSIEEMHDKVMQVVQTVL